MLEICHLSMLQVGKQGVNVELKIGDKLLCSSQLRRGISNVDDTINVSHNGSDVQTLVLSPEIHQQHFCFSVFKVTDSSGVSKAPLKKHGLFAFHNALKFWQSSCQWTS